MWEEEKVNREIKKYMTKAFGNLKSMCVMNQPQPNADTFTNVTQLVIGPRRSNKIGRPLQRLIWDPGPFNN